MRNNLGNGVMWNSVGKEVMSTNLAKDGLKNNLGKEAMRKHVGKEAMTKNGKEVGKEVGKEIQRALRTRWTLVAAVGNGNLSGTTPTVAVNAKALAEAASLIITK